MVSQGSLTGNGQIGQQCFSWRACKVHVAGFPCPCAGVLWHSVAEVCKGLSELKRRRQLESRTQVAKRLAERLGGPACHCLSFRKKSREFSKLESMEEVYSLVVVNFALLT